MENRERKRNKNCTSGIRQMIKMEEENGIEHKRIEKKVTERSYILSEQQKRKGKFCG
jgi:hypothetical protein